MVTGKADTRPAFPFFTCMIKRTIRLCYRKIIDAGSASGWERHLFNSCYAEYRLQSQLYNAEKKYTSFAQLQEQVKGAEQLHFLVSAAATGYLQQLKGTVPDITNHLGCTFLTFSQYRFEIIQAEHTDEKQFSIALNFYSDSMQWLDTVAQYLLLSHNENAPDQDGMLTHLLQVSPFLSIYSVRED